MRYKLKEGTDKKAVVILRKRIDGVGKVYLDAPSQKELDVLYRIGHPFVEKVKNADKPAKDSDAGSEPEN